MISFRDLPQTQKGEVGERIVRRRLQDLGWFVYSLLDDPDRAHPIDTIAMKHDNLILMDTKTKPRRQNYADTGIDIRHYHRYKVLSQRYNLRVYIAFCDEIKMEVYGNYLDILEQPRGAGTCEGTPWEYPQRHQGIIYFPLDIMQHIARLNDVATLAEIEAIRLLSTRKSKYTYETI
jgi:hypothetical protein